MVVDHTTPILSQNSDSQCTHQTGAQENNMQTNETSYGTANAEVSQQVES